MDVTALLSEVPSFVRDLVIGHWPETDVDRMSSRAEAYEQAGSSLDEQANLYEAEGSRAEQNITGETRDGMVERHRVVVASLRNQATVCKDMGRQCRDLADSTAQTQHLLIATGIVLGAQLTYDTLLFFQGGGFKAITDRLAAEQAMRAAVTRLATATAEQAAAGAARRVALHGAVHAAKIGAATAAVTSAGAQAWDMASGVRDGFDIGSFLEMVVGGTVGGVVGAEVGRRMAPHVLERLGSRATTNASRLATHVGGTMIIGGGGGVTGGVAGAIPSLIIHHDEIHSIDDMFKMVRESAITGFGSGFVGASASSLRAHQAGRDAFRGGSEGSPIASRHRDFAKHIDDMLGSDEPPLAETVPRNSTAGDSALTVERLTFHDGTQVIHKVVSDPQHAHAELLTSMVGDAVQARVPAVHIKGDHVYMEVVPGQSALDAYPGDWQPSNRFHDTPSGIRLGVLDALVCVPDRNAESWMVDPDGRAWGIDNSRAFNETATIGDFAEQFQEHRPDGTIQWKEHSLAHADMQEIHQRVEDLRPAFSAAGRRDWHEDVLQRLNALEAHAVGDAQPRPGDLPTATGRAHPEARPIRAPEPNSPWSTKNHGISVRPPNDRPPPVADEASHPRKPPAPVDRGGDEGSTTQPPPHDPERAPTDTAAARTQENQPSGEPAAPIEYPGTDGPPTRPLPHTGPEQAAREDSDKHFGAAPPADGQTKFHRHPEDGHVDVVLTGSDNTRTPFRLLPGNEYILGRSEGALLENLATDHVSRTHATIRVDDDGHVFIRDENSANGTFLDGKQLSGGQWIRVHDGQNLMLSRQLKLGVNLERQLAEVRLFGKDGPALSLHRGRTVDVGRDLVPRYVPGRSSISRDHAQIGMDENGRVWIRDVGSSFGTQVNSTQLAQNQHHFLEPGDSVRFGQYESTADFFPLDAPEHVEPVAVRLDNGSDAIPVELEPGQSVPIGTDESPFAAQLHGLEGVSEHHATLGLDHDGRLWIRDHSDSDGVWINGDRIEPGQKVSLAEGNSVEIGIGFHGNARIGSGSSESLPQAAVHFLGEQQRPIRLRPGEEKLIDIARQRGDVMLLDSSGNNVLSKNLAVGRDFDGKLWMLDPDSNSWTVSKVNGEVVPPGQKRYLDAEDALSIDNVSLRVQIGEETPLSLRLSDDPDAPQLRLGRGDEVLIGRDLDSPLADHLTDREDVSRHHASIYRDEYGDLWLRDEHSSFGSWVENTRVDPDVGPVKLYPGDRIRLGDWLGTADFAHPNRDGEQRPVPIKINSRDGDVALDLGRGGEPLLLGRDSTELPSDLSRIDEISRQHASIGVHPSGRVWIRDEGSTNHTYVNNEVVEPRMRRELYPGDQVSLGHAYEFTIAFPPADGGAFVNIIDKTKNTKQILKDITEIPDHIYQRVSDHMNASPDGGIVVGNRPLLDLPGTDSLEGTPYGRKPGTSWNTVAGVYMGGPRRIVINSGGSHGNLNLAWHEIGHAVDAAYGTGADRLSNQPDWTALHTDMTTTHGTKSKWEPYYDKPSEAFAEAFCAWMHGDAQRLREFTLGDGYLAQKMKDYFDRVFR